MKNIICNILLMWLLDCLYNRREEDSTNEKLYQDIDDFLAQQRDDYGYEQVHTW